MRMGKNGTVGDGRGSRLLRSLLPVIYVPHAETLNYGWLDDAMKFIAYEASADQAHRLYLRPYLV